MAKYKFSTESNLQELKDYFNVSVLSNAQIRQIQKLDASKLAGILTEMPFLVQHLTPKTLENNGGELNAFTKSFIKNENAVASLSVNQKFAIAPALVETNPIHLFDIPNKNLKKLPKETKTKIIEDAAVAFLKDTNPTLRFQNITTLSQHLVQNKGLFGGNNNFGPELYRSLIERVKKEYPIRSSEMLTALFAGSQPRLLESKGKADIVKVGIENGVSLGAIPTKLRTQDIIYRAVMKRPEDIQYSPNPINKTMFKAFVNAASRKIVLGRDTDGKYTEMLSELIKERKISTPPILLHKKVNQKFIGKTLKNAIKKNPELFVSLKNLKLLGFNDKTILANKILAVKAMNATKQSNFFKGLPLKDLTELSKNMKKLPASTRNNLIAAIKPKAEEKIKDAKSTFAKKEKDFTELNVKLDTKRTEILNTIQPHVDNLRAIRIKLKDKAKEVDSIQLDIKNKNETLGLVNNGITEKTTALKTATDSLTAKYVKERAGITAINTSIEEKVKEQADLITKSKSTNTPKIEKDAIKLFLPTLQKELKTLRDNLALEEDAFLKTPAGVKYATDLIAISDINKELASLVSRQTVITTEIANLDNNKKAFETELGELKNNFNAASALNPKFTLDESQNEYEITKMLQSEFPEAAKVQEEYYNTKTLLDNATKEKEAADKIVYNLEKGKDATARIGKKQQAKIKDSNQMEP